MISETIHIDLETTGFSGQLLKKGTWLAVLHAERIPPHIGLIINGNYNSLTIKEREMNIDSDLLLKTISLKKIKSAFIRVVTHPVFSSDHQLSMFQEHLKKFEYVKQGEATCLSPIKLFFKEFYAVCGNDNELFYEFIQHLKGNQFIDLVCATNMDLSNGIDLPYYTIEELNEKIKAERKPYYND